jgi:hypothetical protein
MQARLRRFARKCVRSQPGKHSQHIFSAASCWTCE